MFCVLYRHRIVTRLDQRSFTQEGLDKCIEYVSLSKWSTMASDKHQADDTGQPDTVQVQPERHCSHFQNRRCLLLLICIFTLTMAFYTSFGVFKTHSYGHLTYPSVAHKHASRWRAARRGKKLKKTTGSDAMSLPVSVIRDLEDSYDAGDVREIPLPEGTIASTWKDLTTEEGLTDIMSLKRPEYLSNYKNPCWRERVNSLKPSANEAFRPFRKKGKAKSRWRVRCLPYFLIVGQPKSGTTDLWRKLGLHEQVERIAVKEPHWWTRRRFGGSTLERYIRYFDTISTHLYSKTTNNTDFHPLITGEASASTFWDNRNWKLLKGNKNVTGEPKVLNAHHIRHLLPHVKIIVILRNPIDRLYSDYLYFNKGTSRHDFHERCIGTMQDMQDCMANMSLRACIYLPRPAKSLYGVRLAVGIYWAYLVDWYSVFPRSQIKVLRLDDYSANRTRVLATLYNFLDIENFSGNNSAYVNSLPISNGRRKPDLKVGSMLQETRARLREFYAPYNKQLAALLNDDRFLFES